MKTTVEMYNNGKISKLNKKQRIIKKHLIQKVRACQKHENIRFSSLEIVFYWNEYVGYYANVWARGKNLGYTYQF